jgi:hypothetical protein
VVVALAITTAGTKVPVGLWLGDTENKTVVTRLLADLAARGLPADGGLLAVLDGAKALAAGVKKVFGDNAVIQRCTLHKRRNVKGYLPKELGSKIDWRLARAFADADPAKGLDQAKRIVAELKMDHPDAAASLLEGLEEMFTVRRLGANGRLATTLTNTNCIESMISGGPHHHGQRQELEGRVHEEAVGGRRDARSRTELPPRSRLQRDAYPRRRSPSADRHRRDCHTRQLRSGCCLINAVATAELQQKAGHPPSTRCENSRSNTSGTPLISQGSCAHDAGSGLPSRRPGQGSGSRTGPPGAWPTTPSGPYTARGLSRRHLPSETDLTLGVEPEGSPPVTDVGKYIVVHETRPDGTTRILFDIFNSNQAPG